MTIRDGDCGRTVDELLLDAGYSDAPELRAALTSLRAFALLPAPLPNAELAAMIDGARDAQGTQGTEDQLSRHRRLRKHRPAVVSLAVLTGMGLGVSGVAATSPVSDQHQRLSSVQHITTDWTPGWTVPVPVPPVPPVPVVAPAAHTVPDPALEPVPTLPSTAPAEPARAPAEQASKNPAAELSNRPGQDKETHGRAGASSSGKSVKNDAGAAAAADATDAEALASAAQERARTQSLVESTRLEIAAQQQLQRAGRWSVAPKDAKSAARQSAGSVSSWLQKFRR